MIFRHKPQEVAALITPREFIRLCYILDTNYGRKVRGSAQCGTWGLNQGSFRVGDFYQEVKFHVLDVQRNNKELWVTCDLGRGEIVKLDVSSEVYYQKARHVVAVEEVA